MSALFGQSREDMRRAWLEAWRRGREGLPVSPLEAQLVDVIREHPEYHGWLERGEAAIAAEFTPEGGATNPFLHLSMHLALREQVGTDRPSGIAGLHAKLAARHGRMEAEHRMMDALGRAIWEAQRAGRLPDERAYFEDLSRLA
jgi:hypothetical protein